MNTTIDKEIEKEFFDTLGDKLSKAEIAFKAYEKGKNDMLSVINDIKNEIKEKALFSESIGEPKIASGYYLSIDTINEHIGKENLK